MCNVVAHHCNYFVCTPGGIFAGVLASSTHLITGSGFWWHHDVEGWPLRPNIGKHTKLTVSTLHPVVHYEHTLCISLLISGGMFFTLERKLDNKPWSRMSSLLHQRFAFIYGAYYISGYVYKTKHSTTAARRFPLKKLAHVGQIRLLHRSHMYT